MAKQKIDLPSADSPIPSGLPQMAYAAYPVEPGEIAGPCVTSNEEEYVSTNMVHMHTPNRADTKITRSQALSLMEKLRKLQDEGATLKDGSPIRNKSDVVRWMIEQPLAPIR